MEFSHLEKMGRELKCPICLSLLKSAAMLNCNHVFCNSCIAESMKSISNCPVCKLPFRRREIRPAPHMDNLVNIYKSMEAASGFTIFTTQVLPPKSYEELQVADDKKSKAHKDIMMPRSKRSSKGRRKQMDRFNFRTSDPCSTRPSFSSNKRIHVTPYPVSETPVQHKKSNKSAISTTEVLDISKLESNKTLAYKRNDDSTFPPFFWLSEANEEDEGIERMTAQEMSSSVTPENGPCFSDIKDSDDVSTPKNATPISKSAAQEVFDSQVFEWTQKACSPELFSTPLKQIAGRESFNNYHKGKHEEISHGLLVKSGHLQNPGTSHLHKSAKTTRTACTRKGTLRKKCKQNHVKKSTHEMAIISLNEDHPFGPNEIVHDSSQEKESSKKVIIYPKNCTRQINGLADVHRENSAKSSKEIKNQDIESSSRELAESSPTKSIVIMELAQDKCRKRANKTIITSRKHKRLSSNLDALKVTDTSLLGNSCKDSCRKNYRIDQKVKMDVRKHDDRERLNMQGVHSFAAMASQKVQHASTKNAASSTKELFHLTTKVVLRKCENVDPPVRCAFCYSSNDLEVCGEIMHYFNGKSVSSDYNGGINIIHCHKSCAEWAPNAFFKDDLVINLSTELARSRRITCSCCGIKGAALGCFEKSCRRSFHYPCVKQIPECRWDNENFLMLCPLHSPSKFPSETSDLQKPKRKTCGSKRKFRENSPTSQPIDADGGNCKWVWPSGLPCKWVLCSSALSDADKEILSEFASLTGTSVSKTWSSIVTHVIATTDENGACKRTLKFLMGILEGKWILSTEWIKACMKFMKPVDEEDYEIAVDVHGICNGPHLGRMRIANKESRIFSSFWFYFSGDFEASYKGYLHDLITAAGGKVLQRRPIPTESKKLFNNSSDTTFIVYSLELPGNGHNQDTKVLENKKAECIALAEECGAKVVTNSWILDSIAASALQLLPC